MARAARLGGRHVVDRQTKFLGELPDSRVALVDQLPGVLGNLPYRKITPARPATPAEPRVGLVDGGVEARLLEPACARQPGQARADHDHARRWAAAVAAVASESRAMKSRRDVASPARSSSTRPASTPQSDASAAARAGRRNIWARGVWHVWFCCPRHRSKQQPPSSTDRSGAAFPICIGAGTRHGLDHAAQAAPKLGLDR